MILESLGVREHSTKIGGLRHSSGGPKHAIYTISLVADSVFIFAAIYAIIRVMTAKDGNCDALQLKATRRASLF